MALDEFGNIFRSIVDKVRTTITITSEVRGILDDALTALQASAEGSDSDHLSEAIAAMIATSDGFDQVLAGQVRAVESLQAYLASRQL